MYQYGGREANLGRTSPARPPPPPTELPAPSYLSSEQRVRASNNGIIRSFYAACATGNVDQVRECMEHLSVATHAPELEFGLEEASHNLHIKVVRFLLQDIGVKLHCRCFHRDSLQRGDASSPAQSQSIFTSNREELPDLLRVFLASGWNPNILIQPLQVGSRFQTVALHYPRCVQDHTILRLLLSNGADPNISRRRDKAVKRGLPDEVIPVERGDGRTIEIAINWGTPMTVDILLSHGAALEDARGFHSLVRRHAPFARGPITDPFRGHQPVGLATVDTPYPFSGDDSRLQMAQHLLNLGANVNEVKEVYRYFTWAAIIAMPPFFETTPLRHAVGCADWVLAKWLLQNNADPSVKIEGLRMIYNLSEDDVEAAKARFEDLLQEVKRERMSISNIC